MARDAGQPAARPVVGVTGNSRRFSPSWYCIRLSVWLAGGSARRITVSTRAPLAELDALVISGGDDIHPTLFDEEPHPEKFYDVERDKLEQEYIRAGMDRGLPILGICRGHQLINVILGGSLHMDIRVLRNRTLNRPGILATKTVHVDAGSQLHEVVGRTLLKVNSLHFQAIDRLSPALICQGRDLDSFCQSVASPEKPILGVQWHPEYLFYLPAHLQLFRWLVSACRA